MSKKGNFLYKNISKEIDCKYLITQLIKHPNSSVDSILQLSDRIFYDDLESAEAAIRRELYVNKEPMIDVILKIIKVDFSETKEFVAIKAKGRGED